MIPSARVAVGLFSKLTKSIMKVECGLSTQGNTGNYHTQKNSMKAFAVGWLHLDTVCCRMRNIVIQCIQYPAVHPPVVVLTRVSITVNKYCRFK